MPDEWELYFSFDPENPADASEDFGFDEVSISNGWASGGIMMRETLDFGSRMVSSVVESMESGTFIRRYDEYTASANSNIPDAQVGDWLRLEKQGDVITNYISHDGENWIVVGSDTVELGETFYIGLAGVSIDSSVTTEIIFDNVSVIAP